MKKRVWIGLAIALAVGFGVALALPASHFRLLGWLRREAFYNGWPTSYWVSALKQDPFVASTSPPRDVGNALAEGGAAAVPVLVAMLRDGDREARLQALLALGVMGPESAAAAPAVAETLKTEDDPTCFERAIAFLRQADRQLAVSALAEALKDNPAAGLRARAASRLGEMGPQAQGAARPLGEALRDADPQVRVEAAYALWRIDRQVDPLVAVLLDSIKSKNWAWSTGITALREIGAAGQGKGAIPGLLEALSDEDDGVRSRAAAALAAVGPTKEAVPALSAALKDESAEVRAYAFSALGRTGAREAVPALLAALKDDSAEVRSFAADALGGLGPAVKEAIPGLLVALKDDSPEVRISAAGALARIGPAAKEAIPGLLVALKDKAWFVRWSAAWALGRIGRGVPEVVPALIEALKDGEMGEQAARAIGELGEGAKAAVPALTAALKDESVWVRVNAARSLWQIDRRAGPVLPVLRAISQDDRADPQARQAAEEALKGIDPQAAIRDSSAPPTSGP